MARKERVLLAEDNESIRNAISYFLEMKGYTVFKAENGRAALEIATREGNIDILISDVDMPEMSGRDLSRRLCEIYPSIKTLFLSGYPEEEVMKNTPLPPGSGFLPKPTTLQSLVTKIEETMNTASESSPK